MTFARSFGVYGYEILYKNLMNLKKSREKISQRKCKQFSMTSHTMWQSQYLLEINKWKFQSVDQKCGSVEVWTRQPRVKLGILRGVESNVLVQESMVSVWCIIVSRYF